MINHINERVLCVSVDPHSSNLIQDVEAEVIDQLSPGEVPIRFAVTESGRGEWRCEIGIHTGTPFSDSIFGFNGRSYENTGSFNVVMIVPTGIGAEIGGHAGDATPAAWLLSGVCDTLITHPNVLNASDIIQIPSNAMYVEGSVITQLMMGTAGLRPSRNNRLLMLIQHHEDALFTNAAVNSVNAARASYGVNASIVGLDSRFRMISEYTPSGAAAGHIEGIEYLYEILDRRAGEYDAVGITSVIELPRTLHENYYRLAGEVVNPWGGVEAMLTHAISLRYGIPAAHAPMLESRDISETDFGIVDPRMAAEVISLSYLQCILRGLQKSPLVATNPFAAEKMGVLTSADISCLVIPDGCIGLPTLSALFNDIPVVAVRGNTNKMRNDLTSLPWQRTQLFRVENYLEAAGVVAALKLGIAPSSVLRPFRPELFQQTIGDDQSQVWSGAIMQHIETRGGHAE